jgi:hypothetical protein
LVVKTLTVSAAHVRSHPQAAIIYFPHAIGEVFGEVKDLWWKDK